MKRTQFALYESINKADEAISSLIDQGFHHTAISVAVSHHAGEIENIEFEVDNPPDNSANAPRRPGFGGRLGGVGSGTVRGLGPMVGGGSLGGALLGSSDGDAFGSMLRAGVSMHDAEIVWEGLRRGYALVAVGVDHDDEARSREILYQHDPVDLETCAAAWREEGWEGRRREHDEHLTAERISEERKRLIDRKSRRSRQIGSHKKPASGHPVGGVADQSWGNYDR